MRLANSQYDRTDWTTERLNSVIRERNKVEPWNMLGYRDLHVCRDEDEKQNFYKVPICVFYEDFACELLRSRNKSIGSVSETGTCLTFCPRIWLRNENGFRIKYQKSNFVLSLLILSYSINNALICAELICKIVAHELSNLILPFLWYSLIYPIFLRTYYVHYKAPKKAQDGLMKRE